MLHRLVVLLCIGRELMRFGLGLMLGERGVLRDCHPGCKHLLIYAEYLVKIPPPPLQFTLYSADFTSNHLLDEKTGHFRRQNNTKICNLLRI